MIELSHLSRERCAFRPHRYLAHEKEQRDHIYLIQEGWAVRYRMIPDGRRQITALYLPGDLCDLGWLQDGHSDQIVTAVTPVIALALPCEMVNEECGDNPSVRAFAWREMFAAANRQSEWIVNLGRKKAIERLSHLFCELYHRLHGKGLTVQAQYAMPLTQVDLADIAGLTPVHVNRTLQEMRALGLIELRSKWLRIHDLEALRLLGLFTARTPARPSAMAA